MDHYWREVPGWATFRELYEEVVAKAPSDRPSHFVEIGSWFGKSASLMGVEIINSGKPIKLTCIDPWTDGGPDLRHKGIKLKTDELYQTFLRNVQPVARVLTPLRQSSLEAVKLFNDGELDFVMIDGDHSYEACKADILAWLPKVKQGGILSGDDFNWEGVRRAVRETLPDHPVEVRSVKRIDKRTMKTFQYWVCQL